MPRGIGLILRLRRGCDDGSNGVRDGAREAFFALMRAISSAIVGPDPPRRDPRRCCLPKPGLFVILRSISSGQQVCTWPWTCTWRPARAVIRSASAESARRRFVPPGARREGNIVNGECCGAGSGGMLRADFAAMCERNGFASVGIPLTANVVP